MSYHDRAGVGMVYCLDLANDTVLWNRKIDPGVDRLAISPDGGVLYVPTGEDNTADHINVVDANTGAIVRKVYFSKRSHDTQYPLSGPLFQETKAEDGSGNYLYQIDPKSYAVSQIGPYAAILGPYAVNSASRYVVNDVTGLWGMQVADLQTGRIATAELPEHPNDSPGLMHGIGWTPDESAVWQSSNWRDPHVYIWDMHNPMAPVLKQTLALRSGHGSHWLTFTIKGDYAYVSPNKNSDDDTEIFDARTRASVGVIGSSEEMLEIDFVNGKLERVADQYGKSANRRRPLSSRSRHSSIHQHNGRRRMGTRKTTSSSAGRKESLPTLFTSTADTPARPPRFALSSDLATSLRYLDDAELRRLQAAVDAEVNRRKRGVRSDEGLALSAPRPVPSPVATTKVPEIPEGRANLIRASVAAGLKPATIARTFGLSLSLVNRIIRDAQKSGDR